MTSKVSVSVPPTLMEESSSTGNNNDKQQPSDENSSIVKEILEVAETLAVKHEERTRPPTENVVAVDDQTVVSAITLQATTSLFRQSLYPSTEELVMDSNEDENNDDIGNSGSNRANQKSSISSRISNNQDDKETTNANITTSKRGDCNQSRHHRQRGGGGGGGGGVEEQFILNKIPTSATTTNGYINKEEEDEEGVEEQFILNKILTSATTTNGYINKEEEDEDMAHALEAKIRALDAKMGSSSSSSSNNKRATGIHYPAEDEDHSAVGTTGGLPRRGGEVAGEMDRSLTPQTSLTRSPDEGRRRHHSLSRPGAYMGLPGGRLVRTARSFFGNAVVGVPLGSHDDDDDDGGRESRVWRDVSESSTGRNSPLGTDRELSEEGLIEALPVQEDEEAAPVQEAQPFDADGAKRKEVEEKLKQQSVCCWFLLCAVSLVITVAVASVVMAKHYSEEEEGTTSPLPTIAAAAAPSSSSSSVAPLTGSPSPAPTGHLNSLIEVLPNYTQESLKIFSSPQWQAIDWLKNHPELPDMEEWRKMQLFALVTFYYSFEGPNWPEDIRNNWLQYSSSECYWFSNVFGFFNKEDGSYNEESLYASFGEPCDENGKFQFLYLIDLNLFGFNPVVPPEIEILTSLIAVDLNAGDSNVPFQKIIPTQLFQMTNLIYFGLWDSNVSGYIPTQLGGMRVKEIWLRGNRLTGELPSELGRMSLLQHLDLAGNSFTGSLPSELGFLGAMTSIHLQQNSFSGSIPSEVGLLSNLMNLALQSNRIGGSVPTEFGMMTSIQSLALFNNTLTGSLPSELGSMTQTRKLSVRNNNMVGSLPSELGLMSKLAGLTVAENWFSGSIPTEAMSMPKMRKLWLFDNKFTGLVPTEVGMMEGLVSFRAENNSLTGPITQGLESLATNGLLKELNFDNNDLVGAVPVGLCPLDQLKFDCSGQLCGCCWCPCEGTPTENLTGC